MLILTITKDGTKGSHTAKEFIAKLQPGTPPGKPRMSIAPRNKWMTKIVKVDGKGIELLDTQGQREAVHEEEGQTD